jgi:hypothetical protein
MITAILNRYGWREMPDGRLVYEGFEHLLNPEIPDWRKETEARG